MGKAEEKIMIFHIHPHFKCAKDINFSCTENATGVSE
jgi:hypothetical protein